MKNNECWFSIFFWANKLNFFFVVISTIDKICTCTNIIGTCEGCEVRCTTTYQRNYVSEACTPNEGTTPPMCICTFKCSC